MSLISIITITKDDGPLLERAVESVRSQTIRPDEVEHIIIDSGRKPVKAVVGAELRRVPSCGIYGAINEGIRNTSGDIIGMVHGNDRLAFDGVLERVREIFDADPELDFMYGSVEFRRPDTGRVTRFYDSSRFRPELLDCGFGPAHTTLFCRRRVFDKVGLYDESFRICGDFEMWLRLFDPANGLKWHFEPLVMTHMSPGGVASRLANRLNVTLREKLRALRMHGHPASLLRLIKRIAYL